MIKRGTRKIRTKLQEQGYTVSRRRIRRIMKEQGLVSTYTIAQYKLLETMPK
ncbi:IS3 family transposase [Paenibacillus xylanexedens]|uniref:IS3 family transposase n=1 Tax=Paenibacillus xylanexedens TaxID=528191 RepID=UPI003B01C39E